MKKYTLTEKEYEKVKHIIESDENKYTKIEELVGQIVFVRTVTHYYTGILESIDGKFAALVDAAWIADTGRFADFMQGKTVSEVEPMGNTFVNIDAIIDISPYSILLITQK